MSLGFLFSKDVDYRAPRHHDSHSGHQGYCYPGEAIATPARVGTSGKRQSLWEKSGCRRNFFATRVAYLLNGRKTTASRETTTNENGESCAHDT